MVSAIAGNAGEGAADASRAPESAALLAVLGGVPDPEIPAISVVDLGIVRSARIEDGAAVVAITPTYSGCPATSAIALSIDAALRAAGFARVRIETLLSPPWTTDWISAEGREKLRRYGIAPPDALACAGLAARPACPRCGSSRTEEVSRFGSTPCKAHWRCADCLEPFDRFKAI